MKKSAYNKRLAISNDVVWHSFSDTTVIFYCSRDNKKSFFYELDESGTLIWKLIAKFSPTKEELISELKKKFRRFNKKFEKEVLQFVENLKKKDLIVESNSKKVNKEIRF
ncbi:MAG: PqqD family protein [Candidatus Woesearchaeota archaeon]